MLIATALAIGELGSPPCDMDRPMKGVVAERTRLFTYKRGAEMAGGVLFAKGSDRRATVAAAAHAIEHAAAGALRPPHEVD